MPTCRSTAPTRCPPTTRTLFDCVAKGLWSRPGHGSENGGGSESVREDRAQGRASAFRTRTLIEERRSFIFVPRRRLSIHPDLLGNSRRPIRQGKKGPLWKPGSAQAERGETSTVAPLGGRSGVRWQGRLFSCSLLSPTVFFEPEGEIFEKFPSFYDKAASR